MSVDFVVGMLRITLSSAAEEEAEDGEYNGQARGRDEGDDDLKIPR